MNHNGNANKMVSDTPRTDAGIEYDDTNIDDIQDFARQLERELNAANERIKRLEEAIQERDKEWFQVIESILGFHPVSMTEALHIGIERIKKQKQRIKRLEAFASRFLDPDDLGWAIGKFDRDEAREALGKERVESKAKEDKP